MIMRKNRQFRAFFANVKSYSEWQHLAKAWDEKHGYDRWRENDHSHYYSTSMLKDQLKQIKALRATHNVQALTHYLHDSLHRTLHEFSDLELYKIAVSGTKHIVTEYLAEIVDTLKYLCDHPFENVSLATKQALFETAEANFGCSALMLSGGGAFGIYHLGVVKTLLQQKLLPKVICGSSMGAIVAGVLATHTDEEMLTLFEAPEESHFAPVKILSIREMLNKGHLLKPEQLLQCTSTNIPPLSFQEAYERTGRIVNITVSPAKIGQKARVLNHQTAPDVLIAHACKASCSIPLIFPPTHLLAKNKQGETYRYMDNQLWIDGGVQTDIPTSRLGRLFNVNHFIVSQTNPHVLPFIKHKVRPGASAYAKELFNATVHAQLHQFIRITKRRIAYKPARFWMDHADTLLGQDYFGDINLHPDFSFTHYRKILSNPSDQEIHDYILAGERATWPKIAMIDNQTCISRTLRACRERLMQQAEQATTNTAPS